MIIKRTLISRLFAAVAAIGLAASPLNGQGVTIDVTKVQQRYPWNGLVDIDYTIQWEAGEKPEIGDNLEVLMVDKSAAPVVTNVANCFLQAPLPMTNGSHRITWDANYDGVKVRTDHAEFIVKIAHYAEAYMVIDVSAGPGKVHKVDFLNGTPAGGFNAPKYKGEKIVLKRIHPGSYIAGSPTDEANYSANARQHRVAISKPFYIGIFQITQKQYRNVMGSYNFTYPGDEHPADGLSYATVRGGSWPTTAAPDGGSFMGALLRNCRARDAAGNYVEAVTGFDLPTEFQWEYACRAGTTKAINVTNDFDNTSAEKQYEQLAKVGRYAGNGGGPSGHHAAVGSYEPNAWGLYDMLGNVYEWCRDWYVEDVVSLRQYVDPKGPDSGTDNNKRVLRGASWYDDSLCRSGMRAGHAAVASTFGFRLARILP